MKAFVVERYGGADAVRAGDVPDPRVGDDDVLVRIHAASVNPVDSGSATGTSRRSCRTGRRSSWATTWPGWWSPSAPA